MNVKNILFLLAFGMMPGAWGMQWHFSRDKISLDATKELSTRKSWNRTLPFKNSYRLDENWKVDWFYWKVKDGMFIDYCLDGLTNSLFPKTYLPLQTIHDADPDYSPQNPTPADTQELRSTWQPHYNNLQNAYTNNFWVNTQIFWGVKLPSFVSKLSGLLAAYSCASLAKNKFFSPKNSLLTAGISGIIALGCHYFGKFCKNSLRSSLKNNIETLETTITAENAARDNLMNSYNAYEQEKTQDRVAIDNQPNPLEGYRTDYYREQWLATLVWHRHQLVEDAQKIVDNYKKTIQE